MEAEGYNDIMKIAFQAEEAIDERVFQRFGREYPDKTILIKEGEIEQLKSWPGFSINIL